MTRSLAPGSILQHMYFKRRLRANHPPGGFVYEVGAGTGELSNVLLRYGMNVKAFDMNHTACTKNYSRNKIYVSSGQFEVECADFLQTELSKPADLILSSMVIEHLPAQAVSQYFMKARSLLTPQGAICTFVPASPGHWGIEDEIAGHYKRYTFNCIERITQESGMLVRDISGLTYPLSNWLLGLSNFLVRRKEADMLKLPIQQRTLASGDREVLFKTSYPDWVRFFVNELTLYPFDVIQSLTRRNPSSLVIYFEMVSATHGNRKTAND